jgi:hypothetical protein
VLTLIRRYVETRRKVRRAEWAVAMLRKDAASLRRGPDTRSKRQDRQTALYLESLADVIEKTP